MMTVLFLSLGLFAADESKGCTSLKCQMESYKAVVLKCAGDKSKQCKQDLETSFKALEPHLDSCSPQQSIDVATATNEDCNSLEKFLTDDVIPTSPVYGQVARSLKYINRRAELQKSFKNATNQGDF